MHVSSYLAVACLSVAVAHGKIAFLEEFADGDKWQERWVLSDWKAADAAKGEFKLAAGNNAVEKERDTGLMTSQNSKFYTASALFATPITNKDKPLIFQYQVKYDSSTWSCGGAYLKLGPAVDDRKAVTGDTPYSIMFGPDACGGSRRLHLIFHYKGRNVEKKVPMTPRKDENTHLYTMRLYPNNTCFVDVDSVNMHRIELEEAYEFLATPEIEDPVAVKPEDWDDTFEIPDESDVKPADYVDLATIPDAAATKPEGWNDEDDGEWKRPMIANPEYHGPWHQKMKPNPTYKGPWTAPTIKNPEYKADPELYLFNNIGMVSIDVWQVDAGVIYDNIIVTDDVEEAKRLAERTFQPRHEHEDAMEKEKARQLEEAADNDRAKREEQQAAKPDDDEESEDEESQGKDKDEL